MNTQYPTHWQPAHGGAVSLRRTVAPVLVVLSLLLIPNIAIAQAPTPEEALDAAAVYLRDSVQIVGDWRLGFDSVRASRDHVGAVVDAATHRESLARIGEARELPFYSGEDFGRVVCDASPDPERPGVNCGFSHGTRSMLALTVVSADEERGITEVDVFAAVVGSVAVRSGDELRTGFNARYTTLTVEYDRDGSPRVIPQGWLEFARGVVSVEEIRGAPPSS